MKKRLSKEEWHRRRQILSIARLIIVISLLMAILGFSIFMISKIIIHNFGSNNTGKEAIAETLSNGEIIKKQYLTPNPYSRPQTQLDRINGIVIHYTANPGTSAVNNRSYFEGLATKKETKASSHYIIGLKGEILQCIPLNEVSYASNDRNHDTIAIECCHPDESGKFNDETYASLVSLTAGLCVEFDLKEKEIMRHYDVTEKLCPLYYVKHEEAWDAFKTDVMKEVEKVKKEQALN